MPFLCGSYSACLCLCELVCTCSQSEWLCAFYCFIGVSGCAYERVRLCLYVCVCARVCARVCLCFLFEYRCYFLSVIQCTQAAVRSYS